MDYSKLPSDIQDRPDIHRLRFAAVEDRVGKLEKTTTTRTEPADAWDAKKVAFTLLLIAMGTGIIRPEDALKIALKTLGISV